MEEYKPIKDYEGLYEVSNIGRVRSLDRYDSRGHKRKGGLLKCGRNKYGYLYVVLSKNGKSKTFKVHRLVAEAFIPNPENKPDVDHIDTCRTNNVWTNLRWATRSENMKNEITNKKSSDSKKGISNPNYGNGTKIICVETGIIYNSLTEASEKLNIGTGGIWKCLKGKQKTSGGYHWEFVN